MNQVVTATVDNGVLRFDAPLGLPVGTRVKLSVELLAPDQLGDDEARDELEQLSEEMSIDGSGQRMTRDQLHERH
jgi:hypothetical protein